ncbi:diguanylate cyclase [Limnospira fusiformis CCALA 023]
MHSAVDFDPKHCWGLRRGRPYEVGNQRSGPRCQYIQNTTELAVTLCIPMVAQGETLG